ncbi:hypothetical protein KYN89_12830 [Alteriqipengyuania sp. NZ-12B]|uniref:Uncharacterized protein n=1 Tax=Alteriqipengyuania abyssalis TaxID=2860200 RepID=A0ABS7PHG1_9SPHN|nr:hypothetical protein [Alteriqipengyuania abyssalis]MBY8337928.1 hypothetical protein [Alteriqipengyuania abyssalis]
MADKVKAPDAATSKGQPKSVVAIDNPHIADKGSHDKPQVAFRSSEGRVWRYRGKRARVLFLLATKRDGLTQWDTLPWHTRLGGTIHAMREDRLAISTEIEGEYRHARYRLSTIGSVIEQGENREAA